MQHQRVGTSLCEVLLALALLSATAAWGLQAAAAAERALGDAQRGRSALHRAERALADVDALPCDSINLARSIVEPRWRLSVARDHDGQAYSDDVVLRAPGGDSVRLHRGGWCD
ncbi:MAG: hypothetical protein H7099_19250 [Gemmatimonadaceae bacterium]|nr:hypothetical protein [Gemmatimonadaceae bacterium]